MALQMRRVSGVGVKGKRGGGRGIGHDCERYVQEGGDIAMGPDWPKIYVLQCVAVCVCLSCSVCCSHTAAHCKTHGKALNGNRMLVACSSLRR